MTSPPGEMMALAAGFPPADHHRWMDEVRRVLTRGRDDATDDDVRALFARVLETPTHDGPTLQPLYTAGDAPPPGAEGLPGLHPFTRGALPRPPAGRWDARQVVHVAGDGAAAAGRARHELENGATSVLLDLRDAAGIDVALLDRVLDGVLLDAAAVGLRAGARGPAAADALRGLWAERGVPDEEAAGSLGLDPIGRHATSGGADGPVTERVAAAVALAADVAARHPGVRTITVDASRYHDAGGSDVQQLAYAVATGVAYLRALTDGGLSLGPALGQIEFRLAVDDRQFPAIASVRALRRLWARVAEVAGAEPALGAARVHAISSRAMATRYDPWVNLLRGTIACFSAGIGGAEVVTVEPYDAALDAGSDLGRRLARNTQSLLMDESGLGRVADPAGGSWFVERLTEDLATAAWERFRQVERAGGVVAGLDAGDVQRAVAGAWEERRRAVAHRRDPITGVSEFPAPGEAPPPAAPAAAAPPGSPVPALVPHRYAEPFEDLRARADRAAETGAGRPAVFLATLGPPAVHTARAGFAANLFAAGGVRVDAHPGLGPADDAGAAFAASGATLACICSADDVYAERAAAVAAELRAAGAARVYLAGRADVDGVDETAYAGCDAVALLTGALAAAGVGA